MDHRSIAVSEPTFGELETAYLSEAIANAWITSGRFVATFERHLRLMLGVRDAIVCSSGTAALHLGVLALGVEPDDDVLVPASTYISTANAVTYTGARPVFVDVNEDDWQINVELASQMASQIAQNGRRVAGVVPVDLYRGVVEIERLRASEHLAHSWILQDAAQSFGATTGSGPSGTTGDAGIFSFYGSKIITTGEGGVLVTNSAAVARRARMLRGQGVIRSGAYEHKCVGYNYRMSDLAAAVGVAQLEQLETIARRRREVVKQYEARLDGCSRLTSQSIYETWSANWIFGVLVPSGRQAEPIRERLKSKNIETRPFFMPLPAQGPYHVWNAKNRFPVAFDIWRRGICLPTHANLSESDVEYVCDCLLWEVRK